MESTERMSVLEFQTVCIRFLIEVNGHLQNTELEKEDLHDRLNEVLQQLLCCGKQSGCTAVDVFISGLDDAEELVQSSTQKLSGGVIAEIQNFIRTASRARISV